ncbi:MAG: hypothetical protein ACOC9W_06655 [Persicimonas sp.]
MTDLSEELIAPIVTWADAVDQIDIVSAPDDFLASYGAAYRSIAKLMETGDRGHARSLLTALATCKFVMAEHPAWTEKVGLPPLQPLAPEWLVVVDDGSAEFRLAAALTSLRPIGFEDQDSTLIGPFRAHLEMIDYRWEREVAEAGATTVSWNFDRSANVDWDKEKDVDGLNTIFTRRLKRWTASPRDFVEGAVHAPLADIAAFLEAQTDEAKLSRLCFTLSLVESWRAGEDPLGAAEEEAGTDIDAAFAVARLCYAGLATEDGDALPLNRDIHLLAARGDLESTVEFARAHLRKHGLELSPDEPQSELDPRRLAAALLLPLSSDALARLTSTTT